MKNLKKVLSLVLALAMALSLMTAAFAADASDYKDYSKVTYKEAVDVMTAAGIFNGGDGNNFNPDATLNREQAAKIITYMLVGQEAADKLVTTIAPYSDVAATRWSAGSIAYCTNEGIIAGDGNGRFNPTAGVTGLQFAKMLLVALGYDAKIENLVGNSWAINTASLALGDADLDNGMEEIALSAALTREQAAQMAFNAFKADLVKYANKGTNITLSDGSTVVIGATPAATYKDAKAANNLGETANLTQFAEKYCEKLSLSHPTDAFERPTNEWTYDKVKVGSYADEADLTYTKEVKLGDIYKDLGLSDTIIAANVTFHVDGAAETTPNNGYALSKGDSTKIGGNGVLTEVFYDKDAGTVKITIVHVYGGEVSSVRAATSTKDANITVTPQNAGRGGNYETDEFAVDDVVLYTYSSKSGDVGVQSVVTAEQVTGTLTGYTGGESVTVGGQTYEFNAAASISDTTLAGAVKNDVTLTLDTYGYVVDVDTEATSTNYAVVLRYQDKDDFNDAKAELLFTDGTTKVVNLNDDVDKKGAAGTAVEKGAIVSYTINNKEQYKLTVLENPTNSINGQLTTKGSSTINVAGQTVANGKTIFLVATKNGDDTDYTAYTGIANVPTIKTSAVVTNGVSAYLKSGSAATVVYIDATANTTIESSTKNVIFVLGDSTVGSSYDSVKGTYYKYDAIVNGEITTIESANQITTFGMYTTIAEDKNGVVTLSGNDGVNNGTGTDREANGAIGLKGEYYSYAKDCQVFYIDEDDNISTSSIGGISKDTSDQVWFKVTDGDVTTIVIKQVVATASQISAATASSANANLTVTAVAAVNNSADPKTVKVTVSGTPANGNTITVSPTLPAGASASDVTLTYNGSWSTATLQVTAENGTTTAYTVSVA
ncbi:S-layer homology domain-containing protein [bacterium 210917-SL.2.15]|nr:S-layer homology domain-containing protein [bacterium 210917-SL.2.15]